MFVPQLLSSESFRMPQEPTLSNHKRDHFAITKSNCQIGEYNHFNRKATPRDIFMISE